MPYSNPSLKRMAVAKAIGHATDDLTKVSGQVRNMTARNNYLDPVDDPNNGKGAQLYRPGDCVTAAVVLRLWNAGFSNSETFNAAVQRLNRWYITDTFPDLQDHEPIPEEYAKAPMNPDKPYSPACHVLRDYCTTGKHWSLRLDVRRHATTGAFRHVATLWRDDTALGNGSPLKTGESPQSAHVIVLDEILAQIAAHTIFKGGPNGTH